MTQAGLKAPPPVTGLALIDTGCSSTSVDEKVCQSLGLFPTGVIDITHAGGSERRFRYPVQIEFPEMDMKPLQIPSAVSVNLSRGNSPHIVLVGRDLLVDMKMVYNGLAGRIELAF